MFNEKSDIFKNTNFVKLKKKPQIRLKYSLNLHSFLFVSLTSTANAFKLLVKLISTANAFELLGQLTITATAFE